MLVLVGLCAAACQTQQQNVQSKQAMAVQTAVSRAQFDMNCPSATGQVLSTNVSQPEVQGRWASAYGVQRFEYTVGVRGCARAQDVHRDLSRRRRLLRCCGTVISALICNRLTQFQGPTHIGQGT